MKTRTTKPHWYASFPCDNGKKSASPKTPLARWSESLCEKPIEELKAELQEEKEMLRAAIEEDAQNRANGKQFNLLSVIRQFKVNVLKAEIKARKNHLNIFPVDATVGCYFTDEEAARAYDKIARALQGEDADLNFPFEKDN